jgi:hypothetical protein
LPATLHGHDAPLKMDALGHKDSEAADHRDLGPVADGVGLVAVRFRNRNRARGLSPRVRVV